VEELAERAVGARILVETRTGERGVDARASDAVNLALILNAPIRLSSMMLKDADQDSDLDHRTTEQLYAEGTDGSAAIAADRAEQLPRARDSR
jgi:bifunctional DNase/RNase